MHALRLHPAPYPASAGPVVVAVMDGVGLGAHDAGNAVHAAYTPCLDALLAQPLSFALAAHGPAVGLAGAQDMGNSEVGHNALGAGQVVDQGAKRVARAIASGEVFASAAWTSLLAQRGADNALHLIGLLSDGGVHGHIDHIVACLRAADRAGVPRVFVHALLDGRDVGRTSALGYVDALQTALDEINAGPNRSYLVASGGGRSRVTMDRYGADWPMVARGWRHHVHAEGRVFADLRRAVQTLRDEAPGIGDQDLPPFVVAKPVPGNHVPSGCGPIVDGDVVLLTNFRGDRMLQLVDAFCCDHFTAFDRGRRPRVALAGMTLYDGDTHRPPAFLVSPPHVTHTLGELLAAAGVRQLAVSETQKFGHVTYFWNGNRSLPFCHETAVEVQSHPAPFDAVPQMRAAEVAEAALAGIDAHRARFCRLNLAGGDMVAHTGNFAATVLAIEAVDRALARLYGGVVLARGGTLVVTADHGNAEDMAERDANGAVRRDAAGAPVVKVSHSLNPVPCVFALPASIAPRWTPAQLASPGLANVAASCAALLGYVPPALWAPSLLRPRL